MIVEVAQAELNRPNWSEAELTQGLIWLQADLTGWSLSEQNCNI